MEKLDFESVAHDLEIRAQNLSIQHNPRNLGNDQIVYSISKLVRALGVADKSASTESKSMRYLTYALGIVALLQLFIAYGQYRLGEVQIDVSRDQRGLEDAIWQYDKMRNDRIEQRDIEWRKKDLEFQGRLPVY